MTQEKEILPPESVWVVISKYGNPHSVNAYEQGAEQHKSCLSDNELLAPLKVVRYELPHINHLESNTNLHNETKKLSHFFKFCLGSGIILITLKLANILPWTWGMATFPLWGPVFCFLGLLSALFMVVMLFIAILIIMTPFIWLYSKFRTDKGSL